MTTRTKKETKEINISNFSQLKGVGPQTAKQLVNNGDYATIPEVATAIPEELAIKCHMTPNEAFNVVKAANDFLFESGFLNSNIRTANEDLERRKAIVKIPTGSKLVDYILQGGVETNAITEFFGMNGHGKTQVCHTIAMNAALPVERGGMGFKVLYIDTEGAFRSNRMEQMCIAKGYNPSEVMANITVASMEYKANLILFINNLAKFVETNNIKLIIIDSIIALFRGEYGGLGDLAGRMQKIGALMHKISRVSDIHNVATIITNQMQDNVGGYGATKIPTGGNTLGHASTYRILIGKKDGYRKAEIYKSPQMGNIAVQFHIDKTGVTDVPNYQKALDKLISEEGGVAEQVELSPEAQSS